ncbi:MAG: hypothetical protein IPL65_13450 [Lewinellaceae bacterium]|nr:hypothetical protein [Lewinellaceae bacterium]
MNIRITATTTIGDLQTGFNDVFPYLKLVFFSKAHNAFEGSPAKYLLEDASLLLSGLSAKSTV